MLVVGGWYACIRPANMEESSCARNVSGGLGLEWSRIWSLTLVLVIAEEVGD